MAVKNGNRMVRAKPANERFFSYLSEIVYFHFTNCEVTRMSFDK